MGSTNACDGVMFSKEEVQCMASPALVVTITNAWHIMIIQTISYHSHPHTVASLKCCLGVGLQILRGCTEGLHQVGYALTS
jgi:hypothetical protein